MQNMRTCFSILTICSRPLFVAAGDDRSSAAWTMQNFAPPMTRCSSNQLAARERNSGLADTQRAFHLSKRGQELVVQTILQAIESATP